jgi:hypothetical protein
MKKIIVTTVSLFALVAIATLQSASLTGQSSLACGGKCTNSLNFACGNSTNALNFACGDKATNSLTIACGSKCTNSVTLAFALNSFNSF